ncbi:MULTISPECIES: hypothetical protein [unclassified Fibrobacter]|uniref:hypothetical protein n=1 Tax=unclassified Fibrobacter TaxID=2634177 RepID=UPI000923D337|nr:MULTISPECIES: hypothetical protein [unclassified Fibrobacter]OWV05540.1 hypothetical protein B7993_08025 [Fibrobacter sp. UWH3]SHK45063.1 hypothetical protein SAMN05720765_102263 [Fibrobacter sp. UWH6]
MLDAEAIKSGLKECINDPDLIKKCVEVCIDKSSVLEKKSHGGNMLSAAVAFGLGIGVGVTATYFYNKYMQNCEELKGSEDTSIASVGDEPQLEEIRKWLCLILDDFKLKSKGDYLEKLRVQNRLSNDDVAELQKKYGKILTTPTLIIQRAYNQRFSDNRLLWKIEKKWLEKRGVTGISDTQCQDEIEKILLQEACREMQEEFDVFLKSK